MARITPPVAVAADFTEVAAAVHRAPPAAAGTRGVHEEQGQVAGFAVPGAVCEIDAVAAVPA
nr:hypothetical protein [Nocardia arthritidis]